MRAGALVSLALALLGFGCFQPVTEPGGADAGPSERSCGDGGFVTYPSRTGEELEGCTRIRGWLLVGCEGLSDLSGLSALKTIDRGLNLYQCFTLTGFSGLEGLELAESISIYDSRKFVDLRALTSLQSLEGGVGVVASNEFVSLRGLERIRAMDNVTLDSLEKLEDLDGLQGLERVGELILDHNPRLRSLSALSGLRVVERRLSVRDNPSLPQAEIDAFLARVELKGDRLIERNGP